MEPQTIRVIAEVFTTPKPATMDTQGAAVLPMLTRLGCPASRVSVGKHIEIEMDAPSLNAARVIVAKMCVEFLARSLTEEFRIEVRKIMTTKKQTWVQFAAHGPNIKGDKAHGWRCNFKDPTTGTLSEEIPLTDCEFRGVVSPRNFVVKNSAQGGTGMDGVVGWIEVYGDVQIDDRDILHITLQVPKE